MKAWLITGASAASAAPSPARPCVAKHLQDLLDAFPDAFLPLCLRERLEETLRDDADSRRCSEPTTP